MDRRRQLDHTLWGGELPTKEWIDEFTQDNPVALYRMDGHMILANSAALKIAGIDKNAPDVENGGEIVKNSNGEPTGILKSEAMYLVLNKIPALSDSQKEKAIKAAQDYLNAQGITSIHDVDSLGGGFDILKKIHSNNELKVRVILLILCAIGNYFTTRKKQITNGSKTECSKDL